MTDEIYIGFFRQWLKLCPLTKPYGNPYTFTTIRPKIYSWRYLLNNVHSIYIKKKYAFDRVLITKQFLKVKDITYEIAKEDIDPCDDPLSDILYLIERFYSRKKWWKGEETKMALLTFNLPPILKG